MYDEYRAKLVSVHDADTITLMIDQGFYNWTEQRIRVQDVDCPELNTAEGKVAREFTVRWFETYATPYCMVRPEKNKTGVFQQTFARFVATVYVPGRCLNLDLIEAGYVK